MKINMLYFSHMSYYEIYVLNLRREIIIIIKLKGNIH